ncbi:enoyl-CoA hydratase/isomerase family protein [Halomonas urumqiensis]|uniref:Enoyl-CoA hydratase n=1 Tax=Halomonas urumqiensis TaxID=1684789 RepID=A0A2N7UMH6_9GAMM|nr:enoyl-CoA hydratase-related protein [Halomonas urumqiensis]PMR81628.1 enoyl-CoA hydratase [Halomonas urumqiensis]PTB02265.1 enoyl-CoA hydratase [Halomonas urumqiensis]GHE21733.1 2-(1,2-epoxy-1,2-dihydrophenyl)acetyl-CoA isomerase [Halomonas urumqiensis]
MQTINLSVTSGVATIELDRPGALNAFDQAMRLELLAAIERVEADDEVRVVVIRGAGRGFSAGADLHDVMAGYATIEEQIKAEYKPFLTRIASSEKVYIASVHGAAAGIGAALAMTCDLMLMAESAYIYQAFAAIALLPDGGATWHLVNTLGYKRAFESIVFADKLSAKRCVEWGLANRQVPDDQLIHVTCEWAERLANGAPLAQRAVKQALYQAMRLDLPGTIDLEARLQNMTIQSRDHREGAAAFFEKRAPRFEGA